MHEQPPAGDGRRLQRAIVLQLLSADAGERSSCAQLAGALGRELPEVEDALEQLSETGVLCRAQTDVWASPAARLLDDLGLIAI